MPAVFERQGSFLGGFYIIDVVGPNIYRGIEGQRSGGRADSERAQRSARGSDPRLADTNRPRTAGPAGGGSRTQRKRRLQEEDGIFGRQRRCLRPLQPRPDAFQGGPNGRGFAEFQAHRCGQEGRAQSGKNTKERITRQEKELRPKSKGRKPDGEAPPFFSLWSSRKFDYAACVARTAGALEA